METIVDTEVRVVHPGARHKDFVANTNERVHVDVYKHPEIDKGIKLWGIESTLNSMEKTGIKYSILSGFAWKDSVILDENNAYVYECLNKHKGRFKGFFTPDVTKPDESADKIMSLDKSIYVGVELIPKWQGTFIDDKKLEPIFLAIKKTNLFLKAYTAHPTQTLDGDAPFRTLNFLREHPDITTIIPHLGGLLCIYALFPPIEKLLRNVYFITSVTATMKMVEFAAAVNPNNLLFGTDFPVNHCFDQATALNEMYKLNISDDVRKKILGGTAKKLFGFHEC